MFDNVFQLYSRRSLNAEFSRYPGFLTRLSVMVGKLTWVLHSQNLTDVLLWNPPWFVRHTTCFQAGDVRLPFKRLRVCTAVQRFVNLENFTSPNRSFSVVTVAASFSVVSKTKFPRVPASHVPSELLYSASAARFH